MGEFWRLTPPPPPTLLSRPLMLWSTALSNPSFRLALSNISRSYELRVISRYTLTALFWPILWQRAWACRTSKGKKRKKGEPTETSTKLFYYQLCVCVCTCRSFCGFQSESKMIQVSAAVRLIPSPPARVHSRKTNRSESGLLKRSIAAWRRFPRTRPSIRS